MAVIIDRILKYIDKSENSFTDLSQDFYTDPILKANYAGVILGDGQTLRPVDNVTRQEAVVMLARALSIEESTIENSFTDKGEMADWSIGYINAMTEMKYVSGYGDVFKPLENITRAEVVKILDNAIAKIYNTEGIYTEDIEGLVIINTPNVTLKNMTINGNVIISEGVGEKEAYFEDVIVEGIVYARGGGENCLYFNENTFIQELEIHIIAINPIRVVLDNNSKIDEVTLKKAKKFF